MLGELKLNPLCCAGCEPNVEVPKPPNPVDCWVVGVPKVFVLPNAGEPKAGVGALGVPKADDPNPGCAVVVPPEPNNPPVLVLVEPNVAVPLPKPPNP